MTITPYEKEKLGPLVKGIRNRYDIFNILNEFANSDMDCVKIEGWTQKTATGCYTSFFRSIKHYKMTGIRVVKRGEEIFLIKDIRD